MDAILTIERENVTLLDGGEVGEVVGAEFRLQRRRLPAARTSREPSWMPFALKQLSAVKDLADGWDSRGGAAPRSETIDAATSLLMSLVSLTPDIKKPEVSPTPSGGVQFAWETPSRYFEIELTSPTTAHYYFEDCVARQSLESTLSLNEPLNPAISLLRSMK